MVTAAGQWWRRERSLYVAGGIVLCVVAAIGLVVDRPPGNLWWGWLGGGALLGWGLVLLLWLRRQAELRQEQGQETPAVSLPWLYVLYLGWFAALVGFARTAGGARHILLLGVGVGLLSAHWVWHGRVNGNEEMPPRSSP